MSKTTERYGFYYLDWAGGTDIWNGLGLLGIIGIGGMGSGHAANITGGKVPKMCLTHGSCGYSREQIRLGEGQKSS